MCNSSKANSALEILEYFRFEFVSLASVSDHLRADPQQACVISLEEYRYWRSSITRDVTHNFYRNNDILLAYLIHSVQPKRLMINWLNDGNCETVLTSQAKG